MCENLKRDIIDHISKIANMQNNVLDLPIELLEKIVDKGLSRHDVHNFQMVSTETRAVITGYAHSFIDALYSHCKHDARQVFVRLVLHPEDALVQEIIKLGRLRHAIALLCEKRDVLSLYSFSEFREMLINVLYVSGYSINTRAHMHEYIIEQGKRSVPGFLGLNPYNLELMYDQICYQDSARTDVVQLLLQKGLPIRKHMLHRAVVSHALDIFATVMQFINNHHLHDTHTLVHVKDVYDIVQEYVATLQTVDYQYLNMCAQKRFIFYVECMSLMSNVIPKI